MVYLAVQAKNLNSIFDAVGRHWRFLSKGVSEYNLSFKKQEVRTCVKKTL